MEVYLNKLSAILNDDLMPGEFDIGSALMPQQPLNAALFPNLKKKEFVNFVSNPNQFMYNGLRFLGTSG